MVSELSFICSQFQRRFYEHAFGESIVFSPISIVGVMMLLLGGSNGDTKRILEEYLGIEQNELIELGNSFKLIGGNRQLIHTGIGINDDSFSREFLTVCEAFEADHFSPISYHLINDWISKKTSGLIPKLIEASNDRLDLAIFNAFFFKKSWKNAFPPVVDDLYTGLNNKTVSKQYLKDQNRKLKYFEFDDCHGIAIPYNEKSHALRIFIPKNGEPESIFSILHDFERFSTTDSRFFVEREVGTLKFPKFNFETDVDLEAVWTNHGLGQMFTGDANFLKLSSGGVSYYIDKALHRCKIKVDEKGTIAAAATVVVMTKSASFKPRPKKMNFIVDRPFYFVLVYDDIPLVSGVHI
eukprot:TRINITY_DN3281_c2_g3_i1.p1 TRINITY_DN3281_c2_g3~~TRINITY_DN3281_c2_g3_i1.p1  ORF type:complete len:353 (-),score=93.12 TRINITY_DN3281_c2_g3_i1:147-1205(-)